MCSLNPIGDLFGLGQSRKQPPPPLPAPAPRPAPTVKTTTVGKKKTVAPPTIGRTRTKRKKSTLRIKRAATKRKVDSTSVSLANAGKSTGLNV